MTMILHLIYFVRLQFQPKKICYFSIKKISLQVAPMHYVFLLMNYAAAENSFTLQHEDHNNNRT